MNKFFRKILPAILMVLILSTQKANAFFGESEVAGGFGWVIGAIFYLIGYIASLIFTVGGWLINFAIELNITILTSKVVEVGWLITRDITNLGLVIAIIIMAFSTMLRFDSYGVKNILWKVVVVSLLINFSLVIAGTMIDASHVFTKYFITKATPKNALSSDFSSALASAFQPQALTKAQRNAKDLDTTDLTNFSAGLFKFIGNLFFMALFTILGAITFLGIAVMLMIRYIALGLLLILMPLAWLCWILPVLGQHFSAWWNSFLKWTFFGPAVTFFLYLATYTGVMLGEANKKMAEGTLLGNKTLEQASNLTLGVGEIGNMAIVLGLMMGSLLMANKLGIEGAGAFYKMALGAAKGIGGATGRLTSRHAQRAATAPLRGEDTQKKAEEWQKSGSWLKRQAGIGLNYISKGQAQRLGKNAEDSIKDLSPEQKALRLQDMQRDKQVATLDSLAKEDKLGLVQNLDQYLTDDMKKSFASYGKRFDGVEKAAKRNPEMIEAEKEISQLTQDLQQAKTRNTKAHEEVMRLEKSPSTTPDQLNLVFKKAQEEDAEMQKIQKNYDEKISGAQSKYNKAKEAHFVKYGQSDWQKADPKTLIKDEKWGPVYIREMIERSPGAINALISKTIGENLQQTVTMIRKAQEALIEDIAKKYKTDFIPAIKSATDTQEIITKRIVDTMKEVEKISGITENEIKHLRGVEKTLEGGISRRMFGYIKEKKEEKKSTPPTGGGGNSKK